MFHSIINVCYIWYTFWVQAGFFLSHAFFSSSTRFLKPNLRNGSHYSFCNTPIKWFDHSFGQNHEIVCFVIIFSLYWIILTPLSFYWVYKFNQLCNKNIEFINKRRPKFVIYMVLISNLYPCIIRPISDLLPIYLKPDANGLIFIILHVGYNKKPPTMSI